MSQQLIKSDPNKALGASDLGQAATDIPVAFRAHASAFPIKIQPQDPMKNPAISSDKSIIPALFQIAARAGDPESVPALKAALEMGKVPLTEMMLNAEKLEAVLKAIVKKKKPAARRVLAGQRISASDDR